MKKFRILSAALAFGVLLSSMSAVAAKRTRPYIEEIEYRGNGKLEVSIEDDVRWSSKAKATVTDKDGKQYTAKISYKDDDDCYVTVTGLKTDQEYTLKISGVRMRGDSAYKTVSAKFKATKGLEAHNDTGGVRYEYDD